jgi:hypothetical protein
MALIVGEVGKEFTRKASILHNPWDNTFSTFAKAQAGDSCERDLERDYPNHKFD